MFDPWSECDEFLTRCVLVCLWSLVFYHLCCIWGPTELFSLEMWCGQGFVLAFLGRGPPHWDQGKLDWDVQSHGGAGLWGLMHVSQAGSVGATVLPIGGFVLKGMGGKWCWPVPLFLETCFHECWLSGTCSEKSEYSSYCLPQELFSLLFPCSLPSRFLFLLSWSRAVPSGFYASPACWLFKLQALSPTVAWIHKIQFLSLSTTMALGKHTPCSSLVCSSISFLPFAVSVK